MKSFLPAAMMLGCAMAFFAPTATWATNLAFTSPQAVEVSGIAIPVNSFASGTVVVDAAISPSGEVQATEVRRGIPALTHLALEAVQNWEFSPARFAGRGVAAVVPVAITFRPPLEFVSPVPLPPPQPELTAGSNAEFQPAQITHAAFPNYPADTVAAGTVVLQVDLSATGRVDDVQVLRSLPPLTAEAEAVIPEWEFTPATFHGEPVRSHVVLAFVFPEVFSPRP